MVRTDVNIDVHVTFIVWLTGVNFGPGAVNQSMPLPTYKEWAILTNTRTAYSPIAYTWFLKIQFRNSNIFQEKE